jgi:hypothetical protein
MLHDRLGCEPQREFLLAKFVYLGNFCENGMCHLTNMGKDNVFQPSLVY